MITPKMVKDGYEAGQIRIIDSPNGDGAACQIGDNWFYFGGHMAECETADSYVQKVPKDDIAREVYEALDDFWNCGDENLMDEYLYYELYLEEHGIHEKYEPEELVRLWIAFGDVPIDDGDEIEEPFLVYPKGTYRFDVWHWFDERFDGGVVKLMDAAAKELLRKEHQ